MKHRPGRADDTEAFGARFIFTLPIEAKAVP
jgi:hypothetical protein